MPRRADLRPNSNGRVVPSLTEPRFSQSLERGLAILECFSPERPVIGVHDLASQLGMGASTAHRYVVTLVELGYLERQANRKYRLGLRVTDLGMSALNATGLKEHAHTYMHELVKHTSSCVNLGVLDGAEVLYLDCVQGLRMRKRRLADLDEPHVGLRLAAHACAMGQLLLAHLPEQERREAFAELSSRITPADGRELLLARERITSDGVVIDELDPRQVVVAAPIHASDGVVCSALELCVPTASIATADPSVAIAPHLVACAARISARLGYRSDPV